MRLILFIVVFLLCQSTLLGCSKNASGNGGVLFDSIPAVMPVVPMIAEASGIADSKKNAGHIWVQEDGGKPPRLHLLAHDGKVLKTVYLKGITNRDWEDMTLVGNDIYIGDIGDNLKRYTDYRIYKFAEPLAADDTVQQIETIRFKYPDGAMDAEAFLVDPATKNIYIFTKGNTTQIFTLTYPYSTTALNTATLAGTLNYGGVVSAAISPDAKEIIIKIYTALYHYARKDGEPIITALQNSYTQLPYRLEPQGEAVSFSADNRGYFTLSEKGFFNKVDLYFYRRIK